MNPKSILSALTALTLFAGCGGVGLEYGAPQVEGVPAAAPTEPEPPATVITVPSRPVVFEPLPDLNEEPTEVLEHEVHTSAGQDAPLVWQESFPIQSTPDVFTAFDLAALEPGRYTLSVFYFVMGMPWERQDLVFAVGMPADDGEVAAEEIQPGVYRVWARLLVSGTLIEQYGFTGTWEVAGHLNGDAVPTAGTAFDLY